MAIDINETRRNGALATLTGATRIFTVGRGQKQFTFIVTNPHMRVLFGSRVLSLDLEVVDTNQRLFYDRINFPNPPTAVRDDSGAPIASPLQALRNSLFNTVSISTGGFLIPQIRGLLGNFSGDTLTVHSSTADGQVTSSGHPNWTVVRNGNALSAATGGTNVQERATLSGGNYNIGVGYLDFDTSSIGAGATVTVGTLTLYGTGTAETDTDGCTIEYRAWSWIAGGLTTADWIDFEPVTNWTNASLLASQALNTWNQTNNAANNATSQAGMIAWINKTGTSECAVTVDRAANATAPTGANQFVHYLADNAGTSSDPQLVVTYTPPKSLPIFGRTARIWRARSIR